MCKTTTVVRCLGSLMTLVLAAGCAGMDTGGSVAGERARLDAPGRFLVRYQGPRIDVLVDTEYAFRSVGESWLILNVGIGGTRTRSVEIRREAVRIVTPAGEEIGIPPYEEFVAQYGSFGAAARRAAVAGDPLDYTRADRQRCSLAFQPLPQSGVALDSVWVDRRKLCTGTLYFPVASGVVPGEYQLVIELRKHTVRIPFEVGE